jgi:LemA protein
MDNIFPERPVIRTSAAFDSSPKSNRGKWLAGTLIIIFIMAAFAAWYSIDQYNALQAQDEIVDAEWSRVLNQYSRRADLIPNLVAVVKSYASHESKLFNEIATARARVAALSTSSANSKDPRILEKFQEAQKQLSAPLSRLLVVAETYPDLKASGLYQDLMVQLEGTENRISYSRQRYIQAVADYNFSIRRFPTNLIAIQAGYQPRARFKGQDESVISRPPQVDLK